MGSIDSAVIGDCEKTVRRFAETVQHGELEDAVELFAPGAADEFVASLTETGPEMLLSDDPALVLRRCRRAIQALYGPMEGHSITGSAVREDSVVVTVAFQCENGTTELDIGLTPDAAIEDVSFPDSYSEPEYVDTDAFEEYPVTVDSGDVELEGLVTKPTERENPPVAVLILGAGEHDRDYTSGPNRFFRDLAWGLATEGIATLRYDKRETVTDIPPAERTLETLYFSDGVAALERAAAIEDVDSSALYVVGHSQGGRCAFEIGRRYGDVAGVAALDSPLVKPLERDVEQFAALLEIDGKLPDFVEEMAETYESERTRFFDDEYDSDDELMNLPATYLDSTYEYDQFETAKSLSVPVFISQMEVALRAPEEKRGRWDEVTSGEQDTVVQRPELNHSFQRGEQPRSMLEPALFHRSVDEVVIDDLVRWIEGPVS